MPLPRMLVPVVLVLILVLIDIAVSRVSLWLACVLLASEAESEVLLRLEMDQTRIDRFEFNILLNRA